MATFKFESRDWVEYRKLPDLLEYDYHLSGDNCGGSYYSNMENVLKGALRCIKKAQDDGKKFVLFTHGWSTSRIGKTTTRSQIRKLMRSKEATPYIVRKDCIQHYSVFLAAIKPKQETS